MINPPAAPEMLRMRDVAGKSEGKRINADSSVMVVTMSDIFPMNKNILAKGQCKVRKSSPSRMKNVAKKPEKYNVIFICVGI